MLTGPDVIKALWIAWLIYWLISARGNKKTATQIDPAWRRAAIIGIVVLVVLFRYLPRTFYRRVVPPSDALTWICIAIVVAGLGFSVWARRTLGTNWSANPVIKEDHELIQRGPYALVRHPIYTGLLLALLATFATNGRPVDAAVFVLVLVFTTWKLRIEESLMERQFPQAYPEYRRRTKALIPGLF